MFIHSSQRRETAKTEQLLRETGRAVRPGAAAQKRVKQTLERRIGTHPSLEHAKHALSPLPGAQERGWRHVRSRLDALPGLTPLGGLREAFNPNPSVREAVLARVLHRIAAPRHHGRLYAPLKWTAAVAVVTVLTAIGSPALLLPSSIADSRVVLQGASVSLLSAGDGLWKPLPNQEVVIRRSALIRTDDAAARLIVHDDMVIRLEPHTTIALHDLADRPAEPQYPVTFTLHQGTAWVQGWVPEPLRPIRMRVGEEEVSLNEGSVRLTDAGMVQVWNRHASVMRDGQKVSLLAGEEYRPVAGQSGVVRTIAQREYEREDVRRNLAQDAVHRREIAQMQQERRAAQAGILPGSILYPAKRVAEAVDSALAFSAEERTRKLLRHADTRLSEAAALISQGESATDLLQEYRQTILTAASGSEMAKNLVKQQITSAKADLSATLPGDASYPLKTTVIAAGASLPEPTVNAKDELLADKVQAVKHEVEEGKVTDLQQELKDITPSLVAAKDQASPLREVIASLNVTTVAFDAPSVPALEDASSSAAASASSSSARTREPTESDISREDKAIIVGDALGKLQKYHPDSTTLICSQSVVILRTLWGSSGNPHPDKEEIAGRIMRDGPQPYAGIFRSVYLRWQSGQKIDCNPPQPEESVF